MRCGAWFLVAGLVFTSCGSGSKDSPCGPLVREGLDPSSSVHVLPTATDVEYLSDPPTSGPHQPAPAQTGLVDAPLPRPVQVGAIEGGAILLQYDPEAFDDVTVFADIAHDPVVVAPNADLDDPIVLTAWTAKQSCSDLDVEAVRAFVEARQGQAPGSQE